MQQGCNERLESGWKREVIPPAAPVTTATFPTFDFARASEEIVAYGRCWRGRVEIPNSVGSMVALQGGDMASEGTCVDMGFGGFLAGHRGTAQLGFVNATLECWDVKKSPRGRPQAKADM